MDYANITPYTLEVATLFAEADKADIKKFEDDAWKIANVISNRVARPKRFGATRADVITAPLQFTGVGGDEFNKVITGKLTKEEEVFVKKAAQIVSMAQKGILKDRTGGADHYYNPKLSNPDFGKVYPKTERSSSHIFLKEVPLDKNGKPLKTKKK